MKVIFIVKDDSLVGDRDENLLSRLIGKVVDPVINMIVEAQGPFEF